MTRALTQFFLALAFLVVLVFFNTFGLLDKPISAMRIATGVVNWPFSQAFERVSGFFHAIASVKNLVKENELLTRQVQELGGEVAGLQSAKSENRFLREALGFQAESGYTLVPAEVITFDILNASQTITLNRGRKQGIAEGNAVIVSKNVLVAVVTKVSDSTAQAELLSSTNVSVNAEVLPSRASGMVRGEHGLGLLLDLVSQNEQIEAGQQVVSSGLGGRFPKNLLIGSVGRVVSGGPELFQKASLVPAGDLRHNKVVFVIIK